MVNKKELKQRAIYVYPPAHVADLWKRAAGEKKMSISKFVIEHVQNSLGQEEPDFKTKLDLVQENRLLLDRLREKDRRIDQLDMLVDKLDQDLKRINAQQFSDEKFTGIRSYDKRIIEILKEPGIHSSEELFTRLEIKPQNIESIKALSNQLENLELYGLVKASSQGYAWIDWHWFKQYD